VDVEAIRDVFPEISDIRVRRMFGGLGVFRGDAMFALAFDDTLYMKTDAALAARYAEAGSEPFVYEKKGRRTEMSFWRLPDAALDDPSEACDWARASLAPAEAAARERRAKA
jgi:DNA transformation protein